MVVSVLERVRLICHGGEKRALGHGGRSLGLDGG